MTLVELYGKIEYMLDLNKETDVEFEKIRANAKREILKKMEYKPKTPAEEMAYQRLARQLSMLKQEE